MPRASRNPPGGYVYHVLNRANRRQTLFETDDDYSALMRVLRETLLLHPMRILHYCLMPNHWHFVLWPEADGDLAAFMHHFTTTHATRWNLARDLTGTGHVYQGPYKFFPTQDDDHYYRLSRYVVRNALRANLVDRAEQWRWCSLHPEADVAVQEGPLPVGSLWMEWVNEPQSEAELAALRQSVSRSRPYGTPEWVGATAAALGLEHTLGAAGRPHRSR